MFFDLFNYFKESSDSDPSFIRLVRNILFTTLAAEILIIGLVSGIINSIPRSPVAVNLLGVSVVLTAAAIVFLFRGNIAPAKIVVPLSLIVVITLIAIDANGLHDISILGYAVVVVVGVLLLGRKATFTSTLFSVIGIGIVGIADLLGINTSSMAPKTDPGDVLIGILLLMTTSSALQLLIRRLNENIENARQNEQAQIQANLELRKLQEDLEKRVTERTRQFETASQFANRRARQLEAVSKVSRVINQAQGLQDLLPQITEVISEQFGFYHVGIFLLDAKNEFAILAAANSEGGQKMLERDHKLRVGQIGIVGTTAGSGTPRIALDTGADAVYFNNPDLPATRSEMALPLRAANGQIIGVLDVQSTDQNAFGQEDIEVLSLLADQVAIAISNARFYESTQRALVEADLLYRRDLQTGWSRFSKLQQIAGISRKGARNILLTEPTRLPGAHEAFHSGVVQEIKSNDGQHPSQITFPVKLRGEVVGVLNIKAAQDRVWTEDEKDIVSAIVERAALSIESARLLTESQQRALREQTITEISARISSSTDIETILKTAARELGARIRGTQVSVEIGDENE